MPIKLRDRLLLLHFDFIDGRFGDLKLRSDFFIIKYFIKFKYFSNLAVRINFLLESIFLIIMFDSRVTLVREKLDDWLGLIRIWVINLVIGINLIWASFGSGREYLNLVSKLVAFKVIKINTHHDRVLVFGSRFSGRVMKLRILFLIKIKK